jgi:hypothetical protein
VWLHERGLRLGHLACGGLMATRDEPVRLLVCVEPHGYEQGSLPVFHAQGDVVTTRYRYLAGREMAWVPLVLVIKGETGLPLTEAVVQIVSEDQVSGGISFARITHTMPDRPLLNGGLSG